jgi:phospholipid/cholesterol/gamma-HCH transport system substrate-binding protein
MMAKRGRSRSVLIGSAVAVLFVAAAVFAVNAQHGIPWSTKTTVKASFGDVGSLRVGDEVRIASVRVGQVGSISLESGQAVAELQLSGVDKVYRNAKATAAAVGARSALGLKYVDLQPGTPDAGEIGPGQVIPASKTTGAQDITDLFTVLDQRTRDALGSTLRETGGGLAGHGENLGDALRNLPVELPDLATVSRALSANGGADTTQLLGALDRFAGRFAGRQQEIAALTGNLDATLAAVTVDSGKPLDQVIAKAPSTLADVSGALNALSGPLSDTRSAMTGLRPGADALGAATPDVRGVLKEGVPPLHKVPGVAEQAKPAVDGLTQVMSDAKPLAARLNRTVRLAADPLATLAAYSPEIADFFTYVTRVLSDGDDAGHWARFFVSAGPEMLTGLVPGLPAPLTHRDAYAAPGQAIHQNASPLVRPGK